MRNLKKLFAVVVVVAIMITAMVPAAFAEGTTTAVSADAKSCADLGMLKGPTAAGVTADYTATQPTKIQAAIMLLRLKGLEADALKATGDNFADVKADWMKPYGAYLKAHKDVGFDGIGDNKLDPGAKITAQQYYKVLLTGLGYKMKADEKADGDFIWADTLKFAESKGLKAAAKANPFTVNDIAVSTVETLKAKIKDGSKTLAEDLVAKGAFTKAQGQSAGVIATVLTVNSITALNRAEFQVVFNTAVDKASISLENIKVDGSALNGDNSPADTATLSDDKTTLTVFVDSQAFGQQSNHKISISGIKSTDGVLMTAIDNQSVKFTDTDIPTVKSVKAIGNKKLTVTFSEAIDHNVAASFVYSNYRLDGKVLLGDSGKTPSIAGRELNINLGSALSEGTHKFNFTANTVKDYNGYAAVTNDVEFTVVNDTVKPTVSGIVAKDQQNLEITMSEEVSGMEVYWKDGSVKRGSASIDQDGSNKLLYKVNFAAGNKLPLSATTLYIEKATDYSGNVMDAYTAAVTAIADITRPEFVSVDPEKDNAQGALIAKFSEKVFVNTTYGDVVVKDKDGKVVSTVVVYNKDSKAKDIEDQYRITKTDGKSFGAGTYTVMIKNVVDKSIQANKSIEKTISVAIPDVTGPQFVSANYVSGNDIILVFDEEMNPSTVNELSNYQMESLATLDSFVSLPSGTDITISNSGKVVTLTFPATFKLDNLSKSASDLKKILVRNLKDLGDNTLAVKAQAITPGAKTAVDMVSAAATGKKEIKVQFDTTNEFPVEAYAGDFVVKAGSSKTLSLNGASLDKDNKKIVLSLNDELNTNGTFTVNNVQTAVTVELIAVPAVTKTALGAPVRDTTGAKTVSDSIGGAIKIPDEGNLATTNNVITLEFDENVAAIAAIDQAAAAFVVKDKDGNVLTEGATGADYTVTATGSDNKITITITKSKYTGIIKVSLTGNSKVMDKNNNKISDFSEVVTAVEVIVP